jgi:hypothetical protein
MRKLFSAAVLSASMLANVGCIVPIYHADPVVRTRELVFTSENLRHMPDTWQRIWFLDMPDHTTPFRTHGGII